MRPQARKSVIIIKAISAASTVAIVAGLLCVFNDFGGCGGGGEFPPGTLQWYATCGDPVCSVPDMGGWHSKPGVPLCTTEKLGYPCTPDGTQCDPHSNCNELYLCTTKDPKTNPGGCPISRRVYKTDIEYLDAAGLKRYADELDRLRLATYKYKGGGPTHLGFIIEDVEPSVSVDSPRDMVDLYGYTSMAVAALKLQAQKIAALESELGQLKAALRSQPRQKPSEKTLKSKSQMRTTLPTSR
jgi:hypothetical protein